MAVVTAISRTDRSQLAVPDDTSTDVAASLGTWLRRAGPSEVLCVNRKAESVLSPRKAGDECTDAVVAVARGQAVVAPDADTSNA